MKDIKTTFKGLTFDNFKKFAVKGLRTKNPIIKHFLKLIALSR